MKTLYLENKGLHRWLLADGAVLLLFFALRESRAVMNAFVFGVTLPLEQLLGRLCERVPFSVAGGFYVLLALGALVWLVLTVRYAAAHRGGALYRAVLLLADCVLTFYVAFCLLWGANYAADDFCDRAQFYPESVAYDDLLRVTLRFTDALAACADDVERDENGLFCADRAAILADAPEIYTGLYEEFPFLDTQNFAPKPLFFSRLMSHMNFTGFYFPFTGEANVNIDAPVSALPVTALHEMTHQRGYASEQQCNFLAIVAAAEADDPVFRYSGYYVGSIHLLNALNSANQDAWNAVCKALPENVWRDLSYTNAYWAQFDGLTAAAMQKLNDAMIRSYGDELGIQSYGAVVDLLVKYYN